MSALPPYIATFRGLPESNGKTYVSPVATWRLASNHLLPGESKSGRYPTMTPKCPTPQPVLHAGSGECGPRPGRCEPLFVLWPGTQQRAQVPNEMLNVFTLFCSRWCVFWLCSRFLDVRVCVLLHARIAGGSRAATATRTYIARHGKYCYSIALYA